MLTLTMSTTARRCDVDARLPLKDEQALLTGADALLMKRDEQQSGDEQHDGCMMMMPVMNAGFVYCCRIAAMGQAWLC